MERSTLAKVRYAVGNISLGILGKTGNIPFVLAEPLPYADLVVGIDIARERKRRLPGSVSATAIARIYFGDGQFLRYVIHDTPLEGETVPDNVLQRLFPISEFRGKRVVIHRDGYFRGGEREALRAWGNRVGATFELVEVIKSGTPRIYGLAKNGAVQQPPKGSALRLSDRLRDASSEPRTRSSRDGAHDVARGRDRSGTRARGIRDRPAPHGMSRDAERPPASLPAANPTLASTVDLSISQRQDVDVFARGSPRTFATSSSEG